VSVWVVKMPKTGREAVPRKNVRIPKPVMDEVDEIVRDFGLYLNRQQFVESAIREKVERTRLLKETKGASLNSERRGAAVSKEVGEDLLVRVKEAFMAHAVVNKVREKPLPPDHLDLKRLEQRIRGYVERREDGKKLGKKRLDRLIEEILSYHLEILEGLNL
jgi:Arc/MetJ-type ribon-helix-helix transcriptional regulator